MTVPNAVIHSLKCKGEALNILKNNNNNYLLYRLKYYILRHDSITYLPQTLLTMIP